MRKIKLSQGKYTLVDNEDYDFLNQWKWSCAKKRGLMYAYRKENGRQDGKTLHMHRVVMKSPEDKNIVTDHINGNGLDNRRINLRLVDFSVNSLNRSKGTNSTRNRFGAGVNKKGKKFVAQICILSKNRHIGTFDTKEEAQKAYLKAQKKAIVITKNYLNDYLNLKKKE